jgi:hypothetical protein
VSFVLLSQSLEEPIYKFMTERYFVEVALPTQTWYIIKQPQGTCEIVPSEQITEDNQEINNPEIIEKWGPFVSQGDAIARRIGLIRAGKCQPQ